MTSIEAVQARLGRLRVLATKNCEVGALQAWQVRDVQWAIEQTERALGLAAKRRLQDYRAADIRNAEWYCDRLELAMDGISYDREYQAAVVYLREKREARERAAS